MGHKSDVKKFMERNKDMFGIESKHQENPNHISNWDQMFKIPQQESPRRAFEVQEALVHYPFDNTHKKILEMYYYENLPIKEIKTRIGSKSTNFRVSIQRAKKAVLAHYKKVVLGPVQIESVLDKKVISMGDRKSAVLLVVAKTGEIFWTTESFVRLDDDVQDLLDFDEKFSWDYLSID